MMRDRRRPRNRKNEKTRVFAGSLAMDGLAWFLCKGPPAGGRYRVNRRHVSSSAPSRIR